jgi:hypothetical protein
MRDPGENLQFDILDLKNRLLDTFYIVIQEDLKA